MMDGVDLAAAPTEPKHCIGTRPRVLDGRYELYERLGRRCTSVTYRAYDMEQEREVALELLPSAVVEFPRLRELLRREVQIMAELRHPNVVTVHGAGGWEDVPYLVTSFHAGLELDRWAAREGGPPLPPDVAMEMMEPVFLGVAAMHEAGVIHGDLEPCNVLVSDERNVTVVGVGFSRATRHAVDGQALTSAPGFLVPECLRGDELDPAQAPKIDVYALGVIMHWLLTGQLPWDTPGSIRGRSSQPPESPLLPPSMLRPALSPAFDQPLLRALHDDPRERPSVESLRRMLHRAAHEGTRATPVLIVVVDDDPDALMLEEAIALATVEHAEVVGLSDARAALSLIERRRPDLVITDLRMPGLDGIELTAALRSCPANASTPVLVVTAASGAAQWRRLHRLGASTLVVKPINPRALSDAILGALAQRAVEEEA